MPFKKGHPVYKGSEKGWFKKGQIPWSKDKKGITLNTGRTHIKKGQRLSIKTEFKKDKLIGDKNIKWKGENVSYENLHTWVKRHRGKAVQCEKCLSTIKVEWANKSHEYKRDLEDWLQLCFICHRKYDSGRTWGSSIKKYINRKNRNKNES